MTPPSGTREWYAGLAEMLGTTTDELLWWAFIQAWRLIGMNHDRDLDMALRAYIAQYDKETQDVLDHLDDPENTPIGGLCAYMGFKGVTRWGADVWWKRERELRLEIHGAPTWGPPACGCWTHHEGDC